MRPSSLRLLKVRRLHTLLVLHLVVFVLLWKTDILYRVNLRWGIFPAQHLQIDSRSYHARTLIHKNSRMLQDGPVVLLGDSTRKTLRESVTSA